MGKAPLGVAAIAKRYNKPVIAFAGCVTEDAVLRGARPVLTAGLIEEGEETAQIIVPVPDFVYAPVVAGEVAGDAYICIGETVVGRVKLIYGRTIEQQKTSEKKHFWEKWLGDKS